jgi:alkanesulfonate monooxygenase SsuD/methylene tetrahydromethanopterin reductase-like flavin-dependent oxidoreductase (luciferase family)
MKMQASSVEEFTAYVATVRALIHGETVDELALNDLPDVPPAPIVFGTFGGPRGLDVAARYCDGILLPGYLTPDAVRAIKSELLERCSVHGRQVRLYHTMIAAPELEPEQVREIIHARAVQYFQMPGTGGWKGYMRRNGWDEAPFRRLHAHPQLTRSAAPADQAFTRQELASPAALIPDEWMEETTAAGSIDACIATLQRFADAGVDEFVIHGSSPTQAAKLPAAWAATTPKGATVAR